jgi:hypothetical protein
VSTLVLATASLVALVAIGTFAAVVIWTQRNELLVFRDVEKRLLMEAAENRRVVKELEAQIAELKKFTHDQ